MSGILSFSPPNGVAPKAKILFAARMSKPNGQLLPSGSLMYMIPPLLARGYQVLVSRVSPFPFNPLMREAGELSRLRTTLRAEVEREKPEFVAFPVYDLNASYVHQIARRMQGLDPNLGLVFGASFVTINPGPARNIYGAFPNSILVNGEAEFALPEALDAYLGNHTTDAHGIFVRRNGSVLGGQFERRVSLTPEEHESLDLFFDLYAADFPRMRGLDITSSRGCFEDCVICAASRMLRNRTVTWSPVKRTRVIKAADEWTQRQGRAKPFHVGMVDDNSFYLPRDTIAFLEHFRGDPTTEQIRIVPQSGMGCFFGPDGTFIAEIADKMLRPDGTPFVDYLNIGIDFWAEEERARNRGHREGRLTNRQIRQAVSEFVKRRIGVHAYWLVGDEKTTLTSFASGVLFLSELLLDYAPYFGVEQPEPLVLFTGTRIRNRVLSDTELPSDMVEVIDSVGSGENEIKFYSFMWPKVQVVRFVFDLLLSTMVAGRTIEPSPANILAILFSIAGKWKEEVLAREQRALVEKYLRKRKDGLTPDDILAETPPLLGLSHEFSFLGLWADFPMKELLELVELAEKLPAHYRGGGKGLGAEVRRRNPHYDEQVVEMRRRGMTLSYRGREAFLGEIG